MSGARRDAEGKGERRERGSMARLEGLSGPRGMRNVLSLADVETSQIMAQLCSSLAPGGKPWHSWRALVLQAQQVVSRAEKSDLQ